jgi:excinuclease ABC subunit B
VMYADRVTDSMTRALSETNRRRGLQQAYNEEHGIDPVTITKAVTDILADLRGSSGETPLPGRGRRKQRPGERERAEQYADLPPEDLGRLIQLLEEEMHQASTDLRFEEAARLRDEVKELKRELRNSL